MALRENRITVSFPEATKKRLEELAKERQWTQSQLVREIVKEYLAKIEK